MSNDFISFSDLLEKLDNMPRYQKIYYSIRRSIVRIPSIPKIIKYNIKHINQRRTKGYSFKDVWGLHYLISDIIIGGTRDLAKLNNGYPGGLSEEEWNSILLKISNGFKVQQELIDYYKDPNVKQQLEIDEAWDLLKYWYAYLWD